MKKVKSVDIVLENCEVYNFNADDVNVQLRGLGRNVWGADDFLIAKEAHIQIKRNAVGSGGWDNDKWQDRIHHDITQVWFNYSDGTQVGYHLSWSDKSEYENYYQSEWEDKFYKNYFISPYTTVPPEDF